jgi:hypothetical protein
VVYCAALACPGGEHGESRELSPPGQAGPAVLNDAVTIPEGLALLERSIFLVKAKLVVIDPVMVFLGPNANTDQTVRRALG